MPGQPHENSYYAASANDRPEYSGLEGRISAQVCVIGGGYTGLSAALELAERGLSVVVLEANRVGWGASGRNGGQICTGYASGNQKIESWLGPGDARILFDLSEEGKAIIRDRVARHGIDCDLTWGYFHGAGKRRHLDDLREERDSLARDYDYERTRLVESRDEVGEYVRTPAYVGGLYDSGAGHLHPLNYCLGLARAAEAAGVRIFEGTEARAIEEGAKLQVRAERGQVTADFLVLAGNAYLGALEPRIQPKIMPVGTYIAATGPLGESRAESLIRNDVAVADCNFVLNYFRLSRDRRLLFGGRVSYSTLMPPNLPKAMRRKMLQVFPELSDVDFDYTWGGFVAITMERTPHLGRLGGNIYFAHGFSGQGVAFAGIAGKVLAEAIVGQAGRLDLVARLPHTTFPGGARFRTPTLALAMLWFRLRDML